MKVFVVVNKKYVKQVLDVLQLLSPRPSITLASQDDEVEVMAKILGVEFVKFKDVEKLYTFEKLEEFDVAIAALDDDVYNIAIARVAKSMGIPIVIAFVHNSLNKEEMVREGVRNVIDIENIVSSYLKQFLVQDSWIVMKIIPAINFVIALYRVVKRGVLGVNLKMFIDAVDRDVKVFAIDKTGSFIDEYKPLENGDTIVVIGLEDKVLKTLTEFEKIFRKYEHYYTMKYTDIHRLTGFG
jgi:Trk K+ transport system NAD-binding subunit